MNRAIVVRHRRGVRLLRIVRVVVGWFTDQGHRDGGPGDDASAGARSPGADPRAVLEAAYEAHQREIYSFALRATRDRDAAADATQEAFLRLFDELTAGRQPDNVRAWLYRVASNLILNAARHSSALDRIRHVLARPDSTFESPERDAVRRERDRAVQIALDGLPADAKMGLLLAASGFSGREVAAAIGRTELATRSLLCRARLDLRARLEPLDARADVGA